MIDDRLLLERVQQGDRASAERVVREHYPSVLRFLRHLTWNHEDAPDIAQLTFLRANKGLAGFKFDSSLQRWLHQIAYREYVRWLKTRREGASLEEALACQTRAISDDLITLGQALDGIGDGLRETFLLFEVEGFSVEETSQILEIPVGTVKSRLSRARELLRRRLLPEPLEEIQ